MSKFPTLLKSSIFFIVLNNLPVSNLFVKCLQEVDLRMRITDLQNLYRDKQTRLHQLRTPRKKNLKGGKGGPGSGKLRGPGRPKKKTFPNPRAKMGRPRKQISPPIAATETAAQAAETSNINEEEEEEEDDDNHMEEADQKEEDQPPTLELQAISDGSGSADEEDCGPDLTLSISSAGGGELLRPPRLSTATAGGESPEGTEVGACGGPNTSLSTLTSKFMKGKANPFANLLSQLAATGTGGPNESGEQLEEEEEEQEQEEDEEGEEEEDEEGDEEEENGDGGRRMEESGEKFASDDSSSEASTATASAAGEGASCSSPSGFKFGKTSKLSYCLEAYRHSKKRKAERPKKNAGKCGFYI